MVLTTRVHNPALRVRTTHACTRLSTHLEWLCLAGPFSSDLKEDCEPRLQYLQLRQLLLLLYASTLGAREHLLQPGQEAAYLIHTCHMRA